MTFYVSQAQADSVKHKIDSMLEDTHKVITKVQSETEFLVSKPWQGNQATKFHQAMQSHVDDLTRIYNETTELAEMGKKNIQEHVGVDA